MKLISFLFISFFIVNAAVGKEKVCEPGSHFKESCNSCYCTDDGTAKACTRMECRETRMADMSETGMLKKSCVPNTSFKDKCNNCWCGEDGTAAACTYMACPDQTIEFKPYE